MNIDTRVRRFESFDELLRGFRAAIGTRIQSNGCTLPIEGAELRIEEGDGGECLVIRIAGTDYAIYVDGEDHPFHLRSTIKSGE